MAINTTNKNLYRPDNNTFVNTWDEPVNTNTTGIDYALGGVCYVSMNGRSGTVLMIGTYAATSPYLPDNVGSAGSPVLAPNAPSYIPFNIIASDALNATTTLTLPAGVCGQWSIFNDTTQASGVKLYFGVTGETPLEIPNGSRSLVVSDGVNVAYAQTGTITLGNTTIALGETVTTVDGLTLTDATVDDSTFNNATIVSGSMPIDVLTTTGTPSSTTYLDGTGAWSSPAANLTQIQPLTATGVSNTIQFTLDQTTLAFRSTSASGASTTITTPSTPLAFTLPDDCSLGFVSGTSGKIAIIAYNNAGTVRLGCANAFVQLDESNIVDVVIAAGGTSASTYYASVNLTDVAYRVVGFATALFTTGTGWSAPSLVQGAGGNALSAVSTTTQLGYAPQTWLNASTTPSITRTSGTTYYNTTGKPIAISVSQSASGDFDATVGGVSVIDAYSWGNFSDPDNRFSLFFIVPPNKSYVVTGSIGTWAELR